MLRLRFGLFPAVLAVLLTLPGSPLAAEEVPFPAQRYPAWLDSAVIYHIFPSSFQDSDGDGKGDLEGIRRRLGYVQETGFNTLWLSPVFQSPFEDAGYDITDYYTVDPRFGDNAALERLVEEAHRRGMRVCLDLVMGHTSDRHPWFQASAAGDPAYRDWYIWTDGKDVRPKGKKWVDNDYPRNGYYLKNYYDVQPALNFGYYHPDPAHGWEQGYDAPGPSAVRAEMKKILAFWFDKGVDGFRCDMAWSLVKGDDKQFHGVRHLWNDIFTWVGAHYPEAVFLSEWSSPVEAISAGFDIDIIRHNGMGKTMYRDLVYNTLRDADPQTGVYPPYDCWFDLAGKGRLDTFLVPFTAIYATTLGHGYPCMPTSSHDTWRLNRNQRNTPAQLKVAMTFFLTMPWVPIVYYGEEIGMRSLDGVPPVEGSRDRAAQRTPMQWDSSRNAGFSTADPALLYLPIDPAADRPTVEAEAGDPTSLYTYVKELLALRRTTEALGNTGGWKPISDPAEPYPYLFERTDGKDTYLVAVNPSGRKCAASVPEYHGLKTVYGTGRKPVLRRGTLTVPACSAYICKITQN